MVTIDKRDAECDGLPGEGGVGVGFGLGLGAGGVGVLERCTLTIAPAPISRLESITVTSTEVSFETLGAVNSPSLEMVPALADHTKVSGGRRRA